MFSPAGACNSLPTKSAMCSPLLSNRNLIALSPYSSVESCGQAVHRLLLRRVKLVRLLLPQAAAKAFSRCPAFRGFRSLRRR